MAKYFIYMSGVSWFVLHYLQDLLFVINFLRKVINYLFRAVQSRNSPPFMPPLKVVHKSLPLHPIVVVFMIGEGHCRH